jgi:hypothetical protein
LGGGERRGGHGHGGRSGLGELTTVQVGDPFGWEMNIPGAHRALRGAKQSARGRLPDKRYDIKSLFSRN